MSARTFCRALVATLAVLVALAPLTAQAAHRTNTTEVGGNDAVGAAIAWSRATFAANTAPHVVLGRDDRFPDNLASAVLQGALPAPLLLNPSSSLSNAVEAELERLGAKTVHVMGGANAISASVVQALQAEGYAVHRHAGPTRIETAIAVAREHAAPASTAIVSRAFGSTSGDETQAFADALAAGAWAADQGWPVLLTDSERLTSALATYLRGSAVRRVVVVGGTSAVSARTAGEIAGLGITVERVAGANRFDTAVRVAQQRGDANASQAGRVILNEGQAANAWIGGFTAAAHAARFDAPVVLANGDDLPPETRTWLEPGGATTALWCGPNTDRAACDQGAALLNQSQTGQVTLDETTIDRSGAITGRISPTTDVTGVRVSGPCVDDGTVTLNGDGRFQVGLAESATAGACEITFAVTHRDGRTVNQVRTVTLTETPSLTEAPELLSVVAVSTAGTGDVPLRFTFDTPIRTSSGSIDVASFALYGPDGRRFSAISAVAESGNAAAARVVFSREAYNAASLAAVDSGAVSNVNTEPNPAKAAALKGVQWSAGITDSPDLLSVQSLSKTDDDTLRAVLRFDEAASSGDGSITLVLADGTVFSSTTVATNGSTDVTVDFDGVSTAQSVVTGNLRRVVTAAGAVCGGGSCSVRRATDYASSGITTRPDLEALALDETNDQVVFDFDQAVRASGSLPTQYQIDPELFSIYTADGTSTDGEELVSVSTAEGQVRVQFPEGTVNKAVVGGSAAATAVEGTTGTNHADSVGIARSFAAGEVVAPRLVSATITTLASGSREVVLTFDQAVTPDPQMQTRIFGHTADGRRLAPNSLCTPTPTAGQIRCTFAEQIVLVGVNANAVVQQGEQAEGVERANYPDSVRPIPPATA